MDGFLVRVIAAGAVGVAIGWWGTPVAAAAARRHGIVDRPDGGLKRHDAPVPYLGGVAIYTAFLLAVCLFFDFDERLLGLLLSGSLLLLLGLIDDLGGITPWVKLTGQAIAVWVMIKSGIQIDIAAWPPELNLALTFLWVLGIINAINLIDVLDGLAAGVASIAAIGLAAVAAVNGHPAMAVVAAALAGATLGFLRHNFAPASIYMGDAGAMFVGGMLGALAIVMRYDQANPVGYLSPLLLLAVPIFETVLLSILRLGRGMSPMHGSPDHFALRLRRLGLSVRATALVGYAVAALFGVAGWINLWLTPTASWTLVAAAAAVLALTGVALGRVDMSRPATSSTVAEPSPDVARREV